MVEESGQGSDPKDDRDAVGVPDRAMDLPYLKHSVAALPLADNQRGSDFAVGGSVVRL